MYILQRHVTQKMREIKVIQRHVTRKNEGNKSFTAGTWHEKKGTKCIFVTASHDTRINEGNKCFTAGTWQEKQGCFILSVGTFNTVQHALNMMRHIIRIRRSGRRWGKVRKMKCVQLPFGVLVVWNWRFHRAINGTEGSLREWARVMILGRMGWRNRQNCLFTKPYNCVPRAIQALVQ
jgi:hypothetical protein